MRNRLITFVILLAVAIAGSAAPAMAVPPPVPQFTWSSSYNGWIDTNCPTNYIEFVVFKHAIGTPSSQQVKAKICSNVPSIGSGGTGLLNSVSDIRITKWNLPGGSTYCQIRAYDYINYGDNPNNGWVYGWYDYPPSEYSPVLHVDQYDSFKVVCN